MAHFAVAAHDDCLRQALLQHQIDWNSKGQYRQITSAYPPMLQQPKDGITQLLPALELSHRG
jgi:hypothetical protein